MMRWLKDKKREKRSNSTSQNDGEKEDDYGFGKEKSVAKSPSSRRQLPPTPATPEEKSPHIYEEIPDLPLCCMPDNEKVLLQNKFGKSKHGCTSGAPSEAAPATLKPGATQRDDINPYMVVSVDKEVRQTPTEFHRNGTPEVHCDVIVKDTHCEILLSRKPKVANFRLDNAVLSVGGENINERRNVRSNANLTSHEKRAAADVHSGGNQSSAFSATSSAFSSSSSASKIQAGGASSLTLVNSFEQHPSETCEEANSASENGVITYSSASNFIPRSTKLVFNPLPGKNPCKEAFGSDSSDELQAVGYSSVKEDKKGVNSVSFISTREQHMGSQCVTYASIHSNNDSDHPSIDSHVTYASVQDQHYDDEKIKPNYSFDDLKTHQSIFLSNSQTDSNDFSGGNKTGVIQSLSPSTSSNCIYALVTFPAEPKHYNTISDIISSGFQENVCHIEKNTTHTCVNDPFGCESGHPQSNTDMNNMQASTDFSRISFHVNNTQNAGSQATRLNFSKRSCADFSLNQFRHNHGNIKCTDNTTGQIMVGNDQTAVCAKGQNRVSNHNQEFLEPSGHPEHRLELEFCLCSDDHSSSCGCPDAKHGQDDDVTSVAGAMNEGSGSCRSCGRLIRQITYSESYSDETYEHVYASRLLIRTGRRFSSPDITFSEVSNSEFQDIQNPRGLDFPYAGSRDDSWTSTRGSDIIPPPYNAAASGQILKPDNIPQVKKVNCGERLGLHAVKRDSVRQLHSQQCCTGDTQQSCSAEPNVSAVQTMGCTSNQWDSAVTSDRHADCSFSNIICDALNTNQSRGLAEPINDTFQNHDILPEPKSSAFTGLLSMFSRTKSSKSVKPDSSEISNACDAQADREQLDRAQDNEVDRCDKDFEEIPEKNTRKLSKFFQRLSSKEAQNSINGCVAVVETDSQAYAYIPKENGTSSGQTVSFKTPDMENGATGTSSQQCWNVNYSPSLYKGKHVKEGSHKWNSSTDECEQRVGLQSQLHLNKTHSSLSEVAAGLSETASSSEKEVTKTSDAKSQCKTDSGDTCYEYDISTSSEGEQTGYEYFLSKVRKTLNLEHEVQHIAESSIVRRKRLCKDCKKDGLYSTINDDDEDSDELCPHFAAKFGDLRAIFEDMIVDQRAAILDCLTDFMHSPYNIRGHEGFCHECGCEILTSDSESQTTMCSLLSQQLLRITSPNSQALSCDSDEGTMADNSCESADDDNEENGNANGAKKKKTPYDDNSSGYDEPKDKLGHLGLRQRKKEKKEKRLTSSAGTDVGSKENGHGNHELTAALTFTNISKDAADSYTCSALPSEASVNKEQLLDRKEPNASSMFSDVTRKNWKKNLLAPQSAHSSKQISGSYFPHEVDSSEGNVDHSRVCDNSRSRASFLTDKVLQDIYAPLPSKALSLLASKNYGSPTGLSCTCVRGMQASIATVTTHLAIGGTETPHTGCTQIDRVLQPSSSGVVHCDSDKKSGVASVQKHLPNRKKSGEREIFNFSEKKDSDDPETDRHTMGVHPENVVFANNGCSPPRENVESNDCLAPQTKPGSRMSKKERSFVPGTDGSRVKHRPSAKEGGNKSGYGLVKNSHEGVECSCMSPHTMPCKDSADLALNVDSLTDAGSTDQHSGFACTVVQKMPVAETKADKMKCTRRHRLDLVALDLLPESVVDDHPTAAKHGHVKNAPPKRSKVIEKMAKMFETNTYDDNQRSDKSKRVIVQDLAVGKHNVIRDNLNIDNSYVQSSKHTSQSGIRDNLISDNGEIGTKKFVHVRHSKSSVPDLYSSQKRDNLYATSESSHLNFNESPSIGDIKDRAALKTRMSSSETRRDKDNEIKPTGFRPDNDSGSLTTSDLKSGRAKGAKAAKVRSAAYLTESRLTKQQPSPTPSSSSGSSSSSEKKCGHGKHKVSKKSYNRKRSKHRSERAKHGHGKEERTYYYFSSDFSDIDVVEVDNSDSCNTYTAKNTTHSNALVSGSTSRKQSNSDKKQASTSENAAVVASSSIQNKNTEGGECEQEVYALPSDSADMRSRKTCTEKVASVNPNADIRHTKRTDVYKSRKSNNKLLSDLIIRNNDMQLYENV